MPTNEAKIILSAEDRTRQAVASAKAGLLSLQQGAARLTSSLGLLGGGIGVAAFAGLVKSSIDALDKLNDLNKSTGISVEQLSGLSLAAQQSGTDLEGVAQSINKLSVNIGKDTEKFAALGITAKDPLEAFKQLADVYVAIEDPQKRATVAAAALGKSWASAAPLLAEGGKAIGETVEKGTRLAGVTREMTDQADKFNDQLAELKIVAGRAGRSIATDLIPFISEAIKEFQIGVKHAGSFGNAILTLGTINPFRNAQENIRAYTDDLAKLEKDRPSGVGNAFGNVREQEIARTDAAIKKKKIQIAFLREAAQEEALLLGKGYENYKIRPEPEKPGTKPPDDKALKNFLGNQDKAAKESIRKFEDYSAKIAAAVGNAIHDNDLIKARELADTIERLDALYFDAGLSADVYAAALDKITGANTTAGLEGADQALKLQVETLARLKAEHIDLIDPVEKYRKKLDEVEKLKEAGLLTPDQATEAAFYWNEQIDGALKFGEVAKDTDSSLKDLQRAIEGWGKASADAFVEFAFTGKTSFGGLVDSILKDLARMAAYNAFKPLFNSFSDSIGKSNFFSDLFGGSGGGGGTLFGIKTSAKGNVFDSAGLSAYSGKVVSRPTLFPFASGIGLMGEAGPEAILPLSRGRDGKLGVAGGGNVVNNYNTSIVVESSGEVRSEGNARELGRRFESAVRNVLLTEKRPGGLLT